MDTKPAGEQDEAQQEQANHRSHTWKLKRGFKANYYCIYCGVEMIGAAEAHKQPCPSRGDYDEALVNPMCALDFLTRNGCSNLDIPSTQHGVYKRTLTELLTMYSSSIRKDRDELQLTNDLIMDASRRAVDEWRKQDPEGRRLMLPDLKEHILWAFTELAKIAAERDVLRKQLDEEKKAPRFREQKHIAKMVEAGCVIDFDGEKLVVKNERAEKAEQERDALRTQVEKLEDLVSDKLGESPEFSAIADALGDLAEQGQDLDLAEQWQQRAEKVEQRVAQLEGALRKLPMGLRCPLCTFRTTGNIGDKCPLCKEPMVAANKEIREALGDTNGK